MVEGEQKSRDLTVLKVVESRRASPEASAAYKFSSFGHGPWTLGGPTRCCHKTILVGGLSDLEFLPRHMEKKKRQAYVML